MSRRLFILGSTGSIGRSTLEVIEQLRLVDGDGSWPIIGLAAGSNSALFQEQVTTFKVDAASLVVEDSINVKHQYKGTQGVIELLQTHARKGDLVVAAIVGFAGIAPVLTAIACGCDIALANKESLVAGGKLVMDAVKKSGVRLVPVDSEHSAIHQVLLGNNGKEVSKIILTASGGSLRDLSIAEMESATVEQVLNHPTWSMGAKVTVDSASLMNKALELIEAHWLFGVGSAQLEAVIHPQSIVHGLVEYCDGSVIAQLSPPDMRFPIQFALTYPKRVKGFCRTIDWGSLGSLSFEPIDPQRYPALEIANQVMRLGGTAGTVLNAANEVAVSAFLHQKISFGSMIGIVEDVIGQMTIVDHVDLDTVISADRKTRALAYDLVTEVHGNV